MGLLNDLKNPKPPEGLVRVKVLGVRTAEETKVMATYNSTIYCCLLMYADGHRELTEVDGNGMKRYLALIDA